MTRQRAVILEELRKVDTHPSAEEIYSLVRRRLPRISLGTIYRNLEILSESGQIRRIGSGSQMKRFDGRADNHYHVRCIRCDQLVDAFFHPGMDLDERARSVTDFTVLGHRLEFIGVCPRCRDAAGHPPKPVTADSPA
jgi:Fur family ferric uptake transcriptional regulator